MLEPLSWSPVSEELFESSARKYCVPLVTARGVVRLTVFHPTTGVKLALVASRVPGAPLVEL